MSPLSVPCGAMSSPLKTRFAPSPTGLIHLGNVRTALFSALLAQRDNGVFLLRIEDTDAERSTAAYTQALQEDLRWLGLTWQEGPDTGGPHGPYCQSERGDLYQTYFATLEQQNLAYPCFCSARELDLSRKTQLARGEPPRYPGTCAQLSRTQVLDKLAQRLQPTLRFRVPPRQTVEFIDLVRGPQHYVTSDIGDFIIRRADGSPAFFFSNALDDALMGVTHVLRGEDHLTNTPRQLLLMRALGLREPQYAHLSMILGADGALLSKRHGSRNIQELRDTGYFPLAIINYLARLGHHYENSAFLSLEKLAAEFKLENLGRAPAHFDTAHLLHWQHQAVLAADTAALWTWMGAPVHAIVPTAQAHDFVTAVRPNITFPIHALQWARTLYQDLPPIDPTTEHVLRAAGINFLEHALTALTAHGTDYTALIGHLKHSTGAKGKALFLPLRAALTGALDGPELAQVLPLIGEVRARDRMAACMARLQA